MILFYLTDEETWYSSTRCHIYSSHQRMCRVTVANGRWSQPSAQTSPSDAGEKRQHQLHHASCPNESVCQMWGLPDDL